MASPTELAATASGAPAVAGAEIDGGVVVVVGAGVGDAAADHARSDRVEQVGGGETGCLAPPPLALHGSLGVPPARHAAPPRGRDPVARAAPAVVGGAVGVWAAAAALPDLHDSKAALTRQLQELQREQRRVSMNIYNEERKRQRLLDRAKGLSDDDLLMILSTRASAKAKAQAKATGSARAKATAKANATRARDGGGGDSRGSGGNGGGDATL